jgi:serine/threonine protein kinase
MTEALDRLASALADRYTLERELDAGGMATVYLAEDLKHHRKVAVKVLRPELAAVLGGERFVQEITTTANLQHPHILPSYDSGDPDGFLYCVMPYIEGPTLRDKLAKEGELPAELPGVVAIVGLSRGVTEIQAKIGDTWRASSPATWSAPVGV